MADADDTKPDASAAPLPREPSPYLVALALAYLRAPTGSAHEVDLERMLDEESEEQGFRVAEVLSREEFQDVQPEARS